MNYENLKAILSKGNKTVVIVGSVITLAGVIAIPTMLMPEFKTGPLVFVGFFLALGLLMLIIGLKNLMQITSDKLPVLKAIKEKQKDFIVWIYKNEMAHQVQGTTVATSASLTLHNKYGKASQITLNKKTSPDSVIQYLASEFPDAYIGYADETREAVSKLLNKKV